MVATGSFVFSIPFVALFVAYFAFIPAVVAIVLGEILGKRDWLFYALAGGVVAVRRASASSGGVRRGAGSATIADLDLRACHHRQRHVRRHRLLAGRRPLRRQLAAGSGERYFACAVRIFSAKAEKTPANR